MPKLVSIIDIGTNSCLLLVAELSSDNKIISLQEEARTHRLGSDLASTGKISPKACDRLINILRFYQSAAELHKCDEIVACGTRVFRAAKNAKQVVRRVFEETGLRIQILSASEEARLSLMGVLSGLPEVNDGLVVDIGGGSTEFALFRNRQLIKSTSIPIGALVLSETTLGRFYGISDLRLTEAEINISRHLSHLDREYTTAGHCIVGVGGTVTTLASLAQRHRRYYADRVHGYRLRLTTVERWLRCFRRMKINDLQALIPYDIHRARVLPAGTVLLAQVCKHLKVNELVVSHWGLRWGGAGELFGG